MPNKQKLTKPTKPKKVLQKNELIIDCPLLDELTVDLEANIEYFKEHFNDCSDIIFRSLTLNNKLVYIIYTDGMIDNNLLTEGVLKGLFNNEHLFSESVSLIENVKKSLPVGQVSLATKTNEIITKILSGNIIILFTDTAQALIITLPGWKQRSIGAPKTEPSIRGPKDSFTETLNVNISLIRRRLLHPDCKFHNLTLGTYSKTRISIVYVSSIVNPKLLKELLTRLDRINIDNILEANYIEELIEDAPFSIFPKIQGTERPDKVVSALLEGRIAILQENNSSALIVPTLFIDFFQTPEDYYGRYWVGSFLRLLRYLAVFIAVLTPALFVALLTHNQELIPTRLLITFAYQKEGTPFPTAVEAMLMGFIFEILKEAGTRLPKIIGQTVSIVGALIIGEAAVSAGLASPAMVIVTALTAIAGFTVASVEMNDPIIIIRLTLTLLSAVLGFWGIFIGLSFFLGHLVSLRSLGIPYMTPLAPVQIEDLDDVLFRAPLWTMQKRPRFLSKINQIRQGKNLKPSPDQN